MARQVAAFRKELLPLWVDSGRSGMTAIGQQLPFIWQDMLEINPFEIGWKYPGSLIYICVGQVRHAHV